MTQPTKEQERKFARIAELCQRADQQMRKADKTLERIERKLDQKLGKQSTS